MSKSNGEKNLDKKNQIIQHLVKNAESNTVSRHTLTKNTGRLGGVDYLIAYLTGGLKSGILPFLEPNEQPHYVFNNMGPPHMSSGTMTGIREHIWEMAGLDEINKLKGSALCFTDRNLIFILNRKEAVSVAYEDIHAFRTKKSWTQAWLVLQIERECVARLGNALDYDGPINEFLAIGINMPHQSLRIKALKYLDAKIDARKLIERNNETSVSKYIDILVYKQYADNDEPSPEFRQFPDTRLLFHNSYCEVYNEDYKIKYENICQMHGKVHPVKKTELIMQNGDHILFTGGLGSPIGHYIVEQNLEPVCEMKSKFILVNLLDGVSYLQIDKRNEGKSAMSANLTNQDRREGKYFEVDFGISSGGYSDESSDISDINIGQISDQSNSSEIILFKIYTDKLTIQSDLYIELDFSEIEYIIYQDTAMEFGTSSFVFRIKYLEPDKPVKEAGEYVKNRIAGAPENYNNSSGNDNNEITPSELLTELKNLYEMDLISEIEFEKKKEEIIQEFYDGHVS